MTYARKILKVLCFFMLLLIDMSCLTGDDFPALEPCGSGSGSTALNALEWFKTIGEDVERVEEEVTLKLYVTSSDRFGNIYGALYLQDDPVHPNIGFELRTELSDSYLLYPPGSAVYLHLKGLFVRAINGGVQVGSRFVNFGNLTLSRVPSVVTKEHLSLACEGLVPIEPLKVDLTALQNRYQYLWVQFSDLQLITRDLCKTFATEKETTVRELSHCTGEVIELVNSGYSEFYDLPLPLGKGSGRGILKYRGNDPQLIINQAGDLQLDEVRCEGVSYECDTSGPVSDITGQELMISEIADPANNSSTLNGRFIELFNPGTSPVDLSGWEIRRYTNANTSITESSVIVLPGVILPPGGVFVIAANAEHFYQVYGFSASLEGGASSGADSNGDDNIGLYDRNGELRDMFGVPGEDGTGTAHDFQDGRALRKLEVRSANNVFDPAEWVVNNGHGAEGTHAQTLNAPDDFDPGVHQ